MNLLEKLSLERVFETGDTSYLSVLPEYHSSYARDFYSKPPFKRSACFYVTITGDFERFQNLSFEIKFTKKLKLFLKNWSSAFW